ncbi:hypothetical protein [Enterococcus phage TJE1]|uniref:Uncharacterized protein n=1 Tax=Enterococcus phage TJE1 TaxID=2951262 RepID=A0A976XR25_9CAUD|nr:hypothetical protein [Enterococcus phage TJE1]
MLSKGKQVTLRKLNNIIKNKEYILIGARYTNDSLERDIPITTVIDDVLVDLKKETMAGCVFFRPVGDAQRNALSLLKDACVHFGYGEFLDESIERPAMYAGLRANVMLPDTAFSNIQEIPFNFYFTEPEVFCEEVTIKGRKHIQYTVLDRISLNDVEHVEQSLVVLFRKAEYDGETLLGAYTDTKLTKTEAIKILQFVSNGSLLEQLVGAVTVFSDKVISTLIPLFNDVDISFMKSKDDKPVVSITADTGGIAFDEDDLDSMRIESPSFGAYRLVLNVGKDTVSILIG